MSRLPPDVLNALPEPVRGYIKWLETDADPAGVLADNWHLHQENKAVRALLAEQHDPWLQTFISLPPGTRVCVNEDGLHHFAMGSIGTVLTHSRDGCTLIAFDDPLTLDEGNRTKPAGAWWASTNRVEILP